MGILQARILEWAARPSSRDLPDLGIKLAPRKSPALAGGFFTTSATWEAQLPKWTPGTESNHQHWSDPAT